MERRLECLEVGEHGLLLDCHGLASRWTGTLTFKEPGRSDTGHRRLTPRNDAATVAGKVTDVSCFGRRGAVALARSPPTDRIHRRRDDAR